MYLGFNKYVENVRTGQIDAKDITFLKESSCCKKTAECSSEQRFAQKLINKNSLSFSRVDSGMAVGRLFCAGI
ncbi:MAG: hypothetical protein IJ645_02275 [Ruminococcus sp.]|nr:hypothetical protein [Ruminococcus sp.]